MADSVFSQIIDGRIAGNIEYQDELCVVLHDIDPQAPTHLLIVPKKLIPRIGHAHEQDTPLLGHLLWVANQMAAKLNLVDGFRLVINQGKHGGESVAHLHIHLLGGRPMQWPPG